MPDWTPPSPIDNNPLFQQWNKTVDPSDPFMRTQYGQLSEIFGQDQLNTLIRALSSGGLFQNNNTSNMKPMAKPPIHDVRGGGAFPGFIRPPMPQQQPLQQTPFRAQWGNAGFTPMQQPMMPTFNPASVGGIFNISPTAPWMSGAPQGR